MLGDNVMKRRLAIATSLLGLVGGLIVGGCREKPDLEDESKKEGAAARAPKQKAQPEEPEESAPEGPAGLVTVSTDRPAPKVVDALRKKIESRDSLKLSTVLDHAKNAESVDMSLPATTLIAFADPHHETPVINKSRLAALDLPLKILVWKENGETRVAFNAPAYVGARHAVERAGLFLGPMTETLVEMVESVTGQNIEQVHEREQVDVDPLEGVVKKESQNSVSDTFDELKSLIEDHEKLSLVSTVDFSANAKSVDRSLRLTRLIMFGNPAGGTPLMNKKRTIGIDLPQKLLIYEAKRGGIFVAYNNPFYLAERHELEGADEQLKKIKGLVEEIVAKGTEEL
jgi:uncharacterized protein (DUF302 family)